MKRTVSSDRPLGALSDSIRVSKPYLYWSTSIRRTRSTVSCTAGIRPSAAVSRTAGWIVRYGVRFGSVGHPHQDQAARPRFSPLDKRETSLLQAIRKASISASVVFRPRLSRTAPAASSGAAPMAVTTCEAVTLPDEQAA